MIASQFADSKILPYRLYAVFMHQGSVEFGHYYIYIYDFKKEIWRKYNDNEITEVQNTAEIFENQGRVNPPTPYFLVYVNAAMKDRLVEPVCREIFEVTSDEAQRGAEPSVPTHNEISTDSSAMEVDTDLPSYDETRAGGDPAGTNTKSDPIVLVETHSQSDFAQRRWVVDRSADKVDVEW
jgi:ubiquitin carboxyl-terminal hydrolase 25/28